MTSELHLLFLFISMMTAIAAPAMMLIIAPIWIYLFYADINNEMEKKEDNV